MADIDKLVSIKAMVIRASPVIPDMKAGIVEYSNNTHANHSATAFFQCSSCRAAVVIEVDQGYIKGSVFSMHSLALYYCGQSIISHTVYFDF